MTSNELTRHIVVKVGGSLFRNRDSLDRVVGWINSNIQRSPVIICGGGQLADVVRQLDAELQLSDSLAHDLAIQTMRLNLSILVARFEQPLIATSIAEIQLNAAGIGPVFFDLEWWKMTADVGVHNWETTSDSIAAALAIDSGASELVLLKKDVPIASEAAKAVFRSDLVDASFANWTAQLPAIRVVPIGISKPDWLWINENRLARSQATGMGQ